MKHSYKQLIAGTMLAGLGFAAIAQTPPAGAPNSQAHSMREGGHQRMDRGDRHKRMEERMAKRMGALKQKLSITPTQAGAWTAWATAMKPPAQQGQRPNRGEFAKLTTPQRIDRMRDMRAQRMAHMDARANATKTFYSALSPDQQKTFDHESTRFGDGKRGGRHHHGGEHRRS